MPSAIKHNFRTLWLGGKNVTICVFLVMAIYLLRSSDIETETSFNEITQQEEKSKREKLNSEILKIPTPVGVSNLGLNPHFPHSTCYPSKFVFLKTHKTGSSLIRELVKKSSEKHGLSMTLSTFGPWVGGYPALFNASFHKELAKDKQTDVIFDHMRWNWPEIERTLSQPKNHKRITIVREPRGQFVSSYNYYYLQHSFKKLAERRNIKGASSKSCIGDPYFSLLGKTGQPMFKFVDKLMNWKLELDESGKFSKTQPKFESLPWWFRAKNPQSYDFGIIRSVNCWLSAPTCKSRKN